MPDPEFEGELTALFAKRAAAAKDADRAEFSNDAMANVSKQEKALLVGRGGDTSPDMEVVDAKIAAAEARTDTKFAELNRALDKLATKEDVQSSRAATRASIWTAIGVSLGIVLAVLALAANRFDAGVSAGGALAPYAAAQQERDRGQDRKLDEILRRLPAPRATPKAGAPS